MQVTGGGSGTNGLPAFVKSMWQLYAADYDVISYNDSLLARFSRAEIADATITGSGADPDGDGTINRAEHYFGLDPKLQDTMPGLILEKDALSSRIWHRSQVRPPNARLVLEHSVDLEDWLPVPPESVSHFENEDGLFEVETAFPLPTGGRAFYRIRLTD